MKSNIYWRMTKESWKRDIFSTVSFTAFVAVSIAMISLTAMLFTNLTGAINHLMEVAETPDFLQMHAGSIDIEEIEAFALNRPEIADYQISCFLNLENAILMLGEESLQDSTQDNGISIQGDGFDYMVGLDNELPKVCAGEVYVPVCYESMYQVEAGDVMRIGDQTLTVAGFIRDSQMNSMMASSKRFLVCEEDYEKLRNLGSEEYLIEFLLTENADTNAFQTAYEAANLPMNGPTITRPLIKMMNTLSDGIMIVIILLISVMVLLISLVCIRFMLLTRIVSEAGEAGVLKALGISGKDIRNMFFRRYSGLILAGAASGIVISIFLFQPLSLQMQKLYGVSANGLNRYFYAILSAVLVGSVIAGYVLKTLRKLNEMTALRALTGRAVQTTKNSRMSCIMIVTAIAVFLLLIPSNLYSTLSAPEFVTYMGIGNAEIRMDMRSGEGAGENFSTIGKTLSEDRDIQEYALYQTSLTPVRLEDGTSLNMLIEQGNHRNFPVVYSQGCVPEHEGEIALSYLLSEELGLYPEDEIYVKTAEEYEKCIITGIYSDITNGGKTAKMYAEQLDSEETVMWRIAYVALEEGVDREAFMTRYAVYGADVTDIASYVEGTYGPTINQVWQVSVLVKIVATGIIILVIMLFVRMMIANQRNVISIKKAIGFCSLDIKKSFWKSCVPCIAAGVVLGVAAGCILGEGICGAALKAFGAGGFRFTYNIQSVVWDMLLGGLAALSAVYFGSNGIETIKAVECCRGRE